MRTTELGNIQDGETFTPDNGETWIKAEKAWVTTGGGSLYYVMVTGRTLTGSLTRWWGYTGDEVIVKD